MGGKHRIGKKIAELIAFYKPIHYHEPFCGMFGVGKRVNALCVTASDIHQDLILMLKAVRDGWEGPDWINESFWKELKYADYHSAVRAYVGFGCSFGGRFFENPARCYNRGQDVGYHAAQARRSLARLRPLIQGVTFDCYSYQEYEGQADLLYCDPPYAGTKEYSQVERFNSKEFWDWVWKESRNRVVLVSELECPDPRIKCVLEIPYKFSVNRERITKVMERVFTF
ncbi:MAG: DNA adenine methylase, partial [Anaerolineae bacterium]|nr:DNA adenine methylase [Anaerolineae bacterium]